MTKRLLALLLLAGGAAQAQIVQEHKYPQTVSAFKLSTGEVKYATYVPGTANQVRVYNLGHSLFTQTTVPLPAATNATVDYLSDKLFNTSGSDLEFVLYVQDQTANYAQVFTDAGTSLLKVDSTNFVDVFNSPAGAKLITYQYGPNNYYSRVYALPGTRTALKTRTGTDELTAPPFPNPTADNIRLPYTLPAGQTGTLTVSDALDRQVGHFQVDATFNDLLFDARGLRPGVYLYQVQVGSTTSPGRRFEVR